MSYLNSYTPHSYARIFRPWECDNQDHPKISQQETIINEPEVFAANREMPAAPSTSMAKIENDSFSGHESDRECASCSSSSSKSSNHENSFDNDQQMENSCPISTPVMQQVSQVPALQQVSSVQQVCEVQQVPQVPVQQQVTQAPVVQQAPRVPVLQQVPQVPVMQQISQIPVVQQAPQVPGIQQMPQCYGSIANHAPYYTSRLQQTAAHAANRNYLMPAMQPAAAVNSLPPMPYANSRAIVANASNPYALSLIQHENMRNMAIAEKPRKKRPKNFFCTECPASFSNKGQLTNHIRTHTGERPFVCDLCKKAFTRNEELTRHKRIHSGQKPFPCPICGKFFGRQDHRKKHTKTHYPQEIRAYFVNLYDFIHQFE